jgi:hypothetical protein
MESQSQANLRVGSDLLGSPQRDPNRNFRGARNQTNQD